MNKRRLLKLADLLEADAKNALGVKFDLSVIAVKATPNYQDQDTSFRQGEKPTLDCGTAACAVGLACISGAFKRAGLGYRIDESWGLIPTYRDADGWGVEERFFDIDGTASEFLFQDYAYPGGEVKGADGELLVAQRIRDFVSGAVEVYVPDDF